MKLITLISTLTFLFLLSVTSALLLGAYPLSFFDVLNAFFPNTDPQIKQIIFQLRLPRAANALVTGGLLGLAGALMQVLLRNPLADPYILGISGGAAVATLICLLLGMGQYWQYGFALGGALFSLLLVLGIARGTGSWSSTRLILLGVVMASGWGAVISFILVIAPATQVHGLLFWLLGDLSHSNFSMLALAVLLFGFAVSLFYARDLNLLMRGELVARSLGVNVERLQLIIFLVSSLLTTAAVMLAGTLGFIGLVVPHMIRLLYHSDHRCVLPCSVFLGGSLLCLADTFTRSVFAEQQLPVGVVTALLGVPLFIVILKRDGVR